MADFGHDSLDEILRTDGLLDALAAERRKRKIDDVAIMRIEQALAVRVERIVPERLTQRAERLRRPFVLQEEARAFRHPQGLVRHEPVRQYLDDPQPYLPDLPHEHRKSRADAQLRLTDRNILVGQQLRRHLNERGHGTSFFRYGIGTMETRLVSTPGPCLLRGFRLYSPCLKGAIGRPQINT